MTLGEKIKDLETRVKIVKNVVKIKRTESK